MTPLQENANIVKLTEEDYQRYPSLRSIPETIKVEAMLYEAFFVRPGYITEKLQTGCGKHMEITDTSNTTE